MLRIGDKILHQFNRELGPGEVRAIEGGRMRIWFPRLDQTLQFALADNAFVPLTISPGADPERWWLDFSEDVVERLFRGEADSWRAFRNRLDSLRLSRVREADGLGSYLGGRLQIFPHQLHVSELACASDPVRWLLADEVGLGKTVEACLILSRLLRMGRAERVLVVAPSTLTVQWLGELYRKFHQIFILMDSDRRADVFRDQGEDFNPFEVHPRSVISLEELTTDSRAARLAQEARLDLLVVDEAHRLERRPGHPGNPAYRAMKPIVEASRNVLLLSATPLEADVHGFFALLQLLWPAAFPDWEKFQANLRDGVPLYPCTSSTRRVDIGGLPPRVPQPVDIAVWPELAAFEEQALDLPHDNALTRKRRLEALQSAPTRLRGAGADPRIAWIVEQSRRWKKRGEKILIFVATRAGLDEIKQELEFQTHQRIAVFHEELSPGQRDIEVAQFAGPEGPAILVSTECGGEGRNFEFCRRLILFDLPWNPALVEQRIGRLDRISRRRPVEIVYFRPATTLAGQIASLYEALGIFQEPLGGLERSLTHVEHAIQHAALSPRPTLDVPAIVQETHDLRSRANAAVYHHLHQNRYRPELSEPIRRRIPPKLETLTERVVVEACQQFGFDVIDRPDQKTWYIEFGGLALIDHLPNAPPGSRWLGTFDRETAVARESLDFFASGHPLVEGILMELEDGHRGQIALLAVTGAGKRGRALLGVVKRRAEFETHLIDEEGRPRPEWHDLLLAPGATVQDLPKGAWDPDDAWIEAARARLGALAGDGRLVMVAAVEFLP